MGFFDLKPITEYEADEAQAGVGMRKALGPVQLTALGVGATIGAGIFVITGVAAAAHAGPAILLSFLLAGLACLFSALCYAELAAMIPVAGSAYSYAYATLGRGIAWIIGWTLVAEYLFAAAGVSVGWSGYLVSFAQQLGWHVPSQLSQAPIALDNASGFRFTGAFINLPAVLLVGTLGTIVGLGVRQSAVFNGIMVILKVGVVLLFVVFGAFYVDSSNWQPFVPENTGTPGEFGWSGIVRGAGLVFWAYLGFDAVSTAAHEARNPRRDMPLGLLGALFICTLLYIATAAVLTGITPYQTLNVPNPMFVAVDAAGPGLAWLKPIINLGALTGLASVALVLIYAQSRIFYTMGRDGMISPAFARLHPKHRTPGVGVLVTAGAAALLAGLFPLSMLGEMVSMGTLFAFCIVCAGVWILRVRRPDIHRPFRAPLVPIVPILGIVTCGYMMLGMPGSTWLRLLVWLGLGMLVYLFYQRRVAFTVDAKAVTVDS